MSLPIDLNQLSRTVALFIQAPAQDPPVPPLDSADCSCGSRVPSSGAVVAVQRFRRRLQNPDKSVTSVTFYLPFVRYKDVTYPSRTGRESLLVAGRVAEFRTCLCIPS